MANVSPVVAPTTGNGPGFGFLARVFLWCGVISAAFILFVIVAPIAPWFPEATHQASEVDNLFKFMLAVGGAITIFVNGLIVAFAIHYRRRNNEPADALGTQIHGNTRIEVIWAAIPAVLLAFLLAISLGVWSEEHTEQKGALHLTVHGFQYGWGFYLPDYGVKLDPASPSDPVAIPVNKPVYVSEYSNDVIHSFWVPEFRLKQDVVPLPNHQQTHEQFTPVQVGLYRVVCTEFCGSGHSGMEGRLIKVVSQADFVTWLRKHHATRLPSSTTTTAALIQH